jgi:D-amino-acid dehydrogenase
VTLVGVGAINTVVALTLQQHGFAIEMFDAAPDPRANHPWTTYGCSRGGANARMYTATEADEYSGLSTPTGNVDIFDERPDELGWDVRGHRGRPDDEAWIREYKSVSPLEAEESRHRIHATNKAAALGWEQLFEMYPALADETNLCRGIIRAYNTPATVEYAVRRHRSVGDLQEVFDEAELRHTAPALAGAAVGSIAGGIRVGGFTLDIHRFLDVALAALDEGSARISFSSPVDAVECDELGRVRAIRVHGQALPVQHLVVSPGAYGADLLSQLGVGGQVAGVLGLWHTLPNVAGQRQSIKVTRRNEVAEDANITVGRVDGDDSLIIGSGYGFVGVDPSNIDLRAIRAIQLSVDEMMRDLMPGPYEAGGGPRWLEGEQRYCVRPWTARSVGLFEHRPAANGHCVIVGGHNTGGFAQAPEVADAVRALLTGASHPLHRSPARLSPT